MKTRLNVFLAVLVLVAIVLTRPPAERQARAQTGGYLARVNSWNVGSITSGNAILASNFTATQAASVFRITVVLGSSAPIALYTTDGTHTFTSWLNGATNLSAGCVYTFTTGARNSGAPGGGTGPTAFNFVVGSATTVPYLWVDEVTGSVD